jgi:signal transduction histidine kinase
LDRIWKNSERLDLLVRDVLAYSKVAKQEIDLSAVDLDVFLPGLALTLTESAQNGLKLELKRPLPVVLGHEAYLSQIFSNLVGNAIKFARPEVPPRVTVRAEARGEFWKITIEDNGIGIDSEHFSRIFEMFGRVHADKAYEGTGIGLAIVKKAVLRMGGEIGVDSTVGSGSRFWFTLRKT